MITRMKKLISISTIPVLALALLLVLGTVMADPAKKPAPNLACTIEYFWMPGWKGTIDGDIEGVIIWSPGAEPMRYAGQTSHYGGSFEIWDIDPVLYPDDAVLLLAADSPVGSTTVRHGKNSIWRTSGTVTDASEEFEDWIGRRVHQNGHFTWDEFGAPEHGMGTLRVN